MNQPPFFIKCKIPNSMDESQHLRNVFPSRQHMFVTPACSRLQLQTPPSPLTYPNQPQEIVAKCCKCIYKCCNQEVPGWSRILKNQLHEGRSDSCSSRSNTMAQFSSHHSFQEKEDVTGIQVRETLISETTATTPSSGRRTRTAFTPIQLLVLETAFGKNHYIVGMERKRLAVYLKLTEQQVKVWYQNRRTKYKKTIQQNFS